MSVRRRLTGALVDGFFTAGSAIWRSLPVADPARNGVEVFSDVEYRRGGDPAHRLDVYRPAHARGPLPTVLYLHGGSFRILSKESHFMIATELAKAGYLVFNANYRLAPMHPFPAATEDAAAVYRWLVDNGTRWGADLSRLFVAGESAGGNLTLALGVMTTYERPEPYARRVYALGVVPRAIVPMCGVLQVSDAHRDRGRALTSFLQDRIAAVTEAYLGVGAMPTDDNALADPLLVVERDRPQRPFPPTFASVGTRDPLIEDSQRLGVALDRLGVRNEIRIYEGEPHAFQALTFLPKVRAHWNAVFAFLSST